MSETITFHALDLAGETGLKLYLRKNDGSLLNTGGDAFTDLGSAGVFTATLAESRVGLGTLHARVCDGTETADNSVFEEFLPESETVIGATGDAVLNTATSAKIDDILADSNELQTNWGTGGALTLQLNTIHEDVDTANASLTSLTTNMTTLLGRVTASVYTMWTDLIAMITGSGVNPKFTVAAVSNAPTGSGGGSTTIRQEDIDTIIAGVQAVHLNITEAVENCGFSITSGDTWIQSVTGLGNLTGKKVKFTVKADRRDVDSAAIVMLDEELGLMYLNGAVTTTGWGSITIDDETAGDITLRLESDATHSIPAGKYVDAIKVIKDNADFSLRNAGTTTVLCGVIKEHS